MSLGIGLGAFMQGVGQGITTGRNIMQMRDQNEARSAAQEGAAAARTSRETEIAAAVAGGASPQDAERQVGSFVDHYMRVGAPRVMEQMIASGQPERARQFQTWLRDEGVQRGVRSWAGMIRSAHSGDADGFLTHARAAYNNEAYAPDGQTVTGSRVLRGEGGGVEGMELTFRGRNGEERTQRFNGSEDLYRAGVSFMAPEQVQRFALGELTAARNTRERLATEDRGEVRQERREVRAEGRQEGREFRGEVRQGARDAAQHERALERSREAERLRGARPPTPARPEDVRRSLETIRNNLASTDMNFGRLTAEQQAARVRAVYEQQERDAGAVMDRRSGGTTARPNGITVYRPPAGGQGVTPP